jgi:hypothetical protein
MINAPSIDIKDMLVYAAESSSGYDFPSNLFVGLEPKAPDNSITIFDTYGFPPQLTLDKVKYEYPAVQIRVRNNDYITGWNLIQDIINILHARSQEVWNGAYYSVIYCSSGPALLDWDENGRVRFIANFNIHRREE